MILAGHLKVLKERMLPAATGGRTRFHNAKQRTPAAASLANLLPV